jgi:hypothetical protein
MLDHRDWLSSLELVYSFAVHRIAVLMLGLCVLPSHADLTLTSAGKCRCTIVQDPGATAAERNAARILADTLQQTTGATFPIQSSADSIPNRAILVGPGAAAAKVFSEILFDELAPEEFVIQTKGNRLLLAGGRPRGTLYAVSRFLQEQCGVRWWTPWASRIPDCPTLRIPSLNIRSAPAFEYREPYWYPAFNPEWAVRNGCNGLPAGIPESLGGSIMYAGFVHTFYPLVPPHDHFAKHPEWYSMINGERSTNRAQLCLTNPQLRDFMVAQVRNRLIDAPEAKIISVSQNDWYGACECPDCKALDDAEGSHAGTMLDFVNHVAEKIAAEFPNVAVDTLAYQYTRRPPKTIRPRPNVIVRLCSIECNFREPLNHLSNVEFARDIDGWSRICSRLYVWDYTTDFAHYVQPHPNWFTLGPNLRYFESRNVRGVFEQGAYQSYGSEMAELRSWVLAQLLWNPKQNDRALITEFLRGYYGPVAALPISQYLERMHDASRGFNLTCFTSSGVPFLKFEHLSKAEQLWRSAERAVENNPELLARVQLGHLPVLYAWLVRWEDLQKECRDAGETWPMPRSQSEFARDWLKRAEGQSDKPWTKVTMVNEGGKTPEELARCFIEAPAQSSGQ